jgi:hypothetical protein
MRIRQILSTFQPKHPAKALDTLVVEAQNAASGHAHELHRLYAHRHRLRLPVGQREGAELQQPRPAGGVGQHPRVPCAGDPRRPAALFRQSQRRRGSDSIARSSETLRRRLCPATAQLSGGAWWATDHAADGGGDAGAWHLAARRARGGVQQVTAGGGQGVRV